MTKRILAALLAAVLGFGVVAVTADTADAANGLRVVKKANGLKANGLVSGLQRGPENEL